MTAVSGRNEQPEGADMRRRIGPMQDTSGERATAKPIPDILSQIKDSYRELAPGRAAGRRRRAGRRHLLGRCLERRDRQRADVSEPTVTRFCRAIGCEGVRDFKLKLAQSVVVGRLYLTPAPPSEPNDNGSPLWNVVFGEARNALKRSSAARPGGFVKAAELVASAHQVAVFGLGGSSSALAQETQIPAVPLRHRRLRPFRPLSSCG